MKRLSLATAALMLFATVGYAQTTTTTTGTTPTPTVTDPAAGSFAKLSTGNQRIATAIFEAQKVTTPPTTGGTTGTSTTGTTAVTPPAPTTLTLDQIAYRKLYDKKGWGVIYKDLFKQGLVTERNLGQAMKTYNEKHPVQTASSTSSSRSSIGRDFMNGSGPGASGGNGMGHGHGRGGGNPGHGGGGGHGKK